MVLHFVCVISQDTGVVAGHGHRRFSRIYRLVGLLRVEDETWERIWFAVLEPGKFNRNGEVIQCQEIIDRSFAGIKGRGGGGETFCRAFLESNLHAK